jgi:hypothetical protein
MTTEWADLPNAEYIDSVLSSVAAYSYKWTTAQHIAFDAFGWTATNDAYDISLVAVKAIGLEQMRYKVADVADDSACSADAICAAQDAILALIAYDDCAHLLNAKLEYVQMIALLGNPAAVLLYPACIAMNTVD